MATIATDDGASSARGDSSYSHLPNKLVRAANGIDYAYRDAGPGASGPGTGTGQTRPAGRRAASAVCGGSWLICEDDLAGSADARL
jgi:hypothetical protein